MSDRHRPHAPGESLRKLLPWSIALLAALAYANSFAVPFVFDDIPSIVENRQLRGVHAVWQVFMDPGRVDITVSGRPVAAWSLALNHALGGLAVAGYHAVNLAIHLSAGLLLYGIVRRTLQLPRFAARTASHSAELAAACALLFLLHPLQTQAVTYVVQRVELLAALWYLLTLYCVLRGSTDGAPRRWFACAVLCCALGMGSKEVMVSAPIAVLLFDRCCLTGSFAAAWRARRNLYLGLASTWALLFWLVATSPRLKVAGEAVVNVSPFEYLRIQAEAILHYLTLSVFPAELVFDYGIVGDGVAVPQQLSQYLPSGLLLLALFALCLWGVIRNRVFGFLGLCFFMLLAPSSSLVPIPLEPMAEHRMYLPLAILGAGLVALSWALIGRVGALRENPARAAKLVLATCALLGVVLGARTFARNRDYASDLALWKDTAEKRPGSARALTNHGLALAASGDLDGAIGRQREALRVRPQYSEAHHNLASALMLRSQFTEAEASYRKAIELSPDAVESRVGLGEALVRSSRLDEAAVEFEAALRLRGDLYGAQRSLAAIRLQQERLDESAAHFIAALRLDGSDPQLWNLLGTIYARQGKYDLAGEQFRAALRVRPDFPDARANLQRLAEMRAPKQK